MGGWARLAAKRQSAFAKAGVSRRVLDAVIPPSSWRSSQGAPGGMVRKVPTADSSHVYRGCMRCVYVVLGENLMRHPISEHSKLGPISR